jgi:hypothetical protein
MSVKEDTIVLTRERALRYLKVYNADIDWAPHVDTLARRIVKQNDPSSQDKLRKQIACTILLPAMEKEVLTDPPQNLLFYCSKYHQFETTDWLELFSTVVRKDQMIDEVRSKALNLGIIYPLDYNPNTRQAFNWLYDNAVSAEDLTEDNKEDLVKKLQNMVYAYGGAVICSVFGKPELKPKLSKIVNWRSGYFFERLIFEAYKPEEILRIKQHELNKLTNINSKLVKRVKA